MLMMLMLLLLNADGGIEPAGRVRLMLAAQQADGEVRRHSADIDRGNKLPTDRITPPAVQG